MRIIIIGSTQIGSSDAALLMMKGFERQGCRTRFISLAEDEPLTGKLGHSLGCEKFRHNRLSRYLLKTIVRFKPDVVYLHGSNTCLHPRDIVRIKDRLGCSIVLWELNQRQLRQGGKQMEAMSLYDHVFALDSYMLPIFKILGAKNVHHLPACADGEEHFPIQLSPGLEKRYRAEISFIGTASPGRVELLSYVRHRDLKIYGKSWPVSGFSCAENISSEPVYGLKKTIIYSASRISFHLERFHMVSGVNFRVFEVAACAGVVFAKKTDDLLASFKPGKEVVLFENGPDLRDKADYYLSHPEILRDIGRAARQRVLREHTYEHRVKRVLEEIAGEPAVRKAK